MAVQNRDTIARRQVDKFAERRDQLAAAALQTLAERGYANTSLRDIAQNSEFSHGVLHYYFADKFELIMYCVRQYKAECVTRYDSIVATAVGADQLRRGFGAAMAATLVEDAALHRLWYDLRNQSLFDEKFRADVGDIDQSLERMIWRIVAKFGELSDDTARGHPGAGLRPARRRLPARAAAPPGRRRDRRRRRSTRTSGRSCRPCSGRTSRRRCRGDDLGQRAGAGHRQRNFSPSCEAVNPSDS